MNSEDRIARIISLVPGAIFTARGDHLVWHDPRPMPTDDEIAAAELPDPVEPITAESLLNMLVEKGVLTEADLSARRRIARKS